MLSLTIFASTGTARYVTMFFTITRDMSSFIIMIGIFVVSNGFALTLLFPIHVIDGNDVNQTIWNISQATAVSHAVGRLSSAMFTSFDMMMGTYDKTLLDDAYSPLLAYVVFFEYIILVNLVMLNLLIALMGGSCETNQFCACGVECVGG